MPYPVIELITQNLDETLRDVRTSGGFNVDLIVERENQKGNRLRDNLAVLKQQQTQRVDQPDVPQERVAYHQQYWIECYVVESEDSTRPIDQRINYVRSDVERAVMVDHTRGGNAIDTFVRDPIPIVDSEGRWEGIVVVLDVHYRTAYSDPYTRG